MDAKFISIFHNHLVAMIDCCKGLIESTPIEEKERRSYLQGQVDAFTSDRGMLAFYAQKHGIDIEPITTSKK